MTYGSLFSGIGGLDLGLDRAGFQCRWQCEIDYYGPRILAEHWPNTRRWDDVRTFPPDPADDWRVDLVAGGFPCQDISSSGLKRGLDGDKSGLWFEMARIVRVLRPRIVLIENVAAFAARGLDRVLCDLAALGFDADWETLPTAAFGLPQRRERLFVAAYPTGGGFEAGPFARLSGREAQQIARHFLDGLAQAEHAAQEAASLILRMDDGLPKWMDRVRTIGNSVAPPVAEWVGRRILEAS
jgi:DNA (cytosine-5)-methyltransferase 1